MPSHRSRIKGFFYKRTIIGFRRIEAIVWILFHASLALILGSLLFLSGVFESGEFMPLRDFVFIQLYVLTIKAIYILPFWWLFFRILRQRSMFLKLPLHVLAAIAYVSMAVGSAWFVQTELLHENYSRGAVSTDIYGALVNYFFHFTVFHAYNFWLQGQSQTKNERELKELAYQSEITALKAQISPHFLFNTLNSITASVPSHLEKTRVLIAKLADTFRYSLRVTEMERVYLQDEIDFIKTWLTLEQQRFSDRLHVIYDIDPAAGAIQVPPMILQPIIENSLKHGISPLPHGGIITIACRVSKNYLYMAITDTGNGLANLTMPLFEKGVALRNISRRLHLLYNETISMNQDAKSFTVSFYIPIELQ